MSTIQSLGIGSGLKIDEIVTALVDAEKVPKEQAILRKEELTTAKISAYGEIKSRLATFQSSVSALRLTSNFNQKEAASSDASAFTATASSLAEVAAYNIEVNSLAKAQSLSTAAFSTVDDVIGTGTITVKFGKTTITDTPSYAFDRDLNAQEKTITIDGTNNTVAGLKDHINNNDYGFTAAIINDGSGYRLVLSAESGVNNSLQLSITDDGDGIDGDNAGLSRLTMDDSAQYLTENVAAQNASLSINGIPITSETNTVANALNGITLDLFSETTSAKTLTVTAQTSQLKEQVTTLVESYNEFITYTSELTAFSGATGEGSLLLGDSTTRNLVNQIRSTMFSQVAGVESGLQALSNIGILSTQSNGSLEFDESKFDTAIATQGDQFQALFASSGVASDPNIQFVSGTGFTKEGTYNVSISQLATKGSFAGNPVLPNFGIGETLLVDDDNESFEVRVDGFNSGPLLIPQDTYTSGQALATALQDQINGAENLSNKGINVTVTYNQAQDRFDFESGSYGSASGVAFINVDSNSATTLGLFTGSGSNGQDVAGTINGITATGEGQFLSVNEGDARGIKLGVLGGLTSPGGEPRGTVTFSRGIADKINTLLDSFLEPSNGFLTSKIDGLDDTLASYALDKEDLNFTIDRLEVRLLAQFNAIDVVVGQLNNLSSFLTSALATLPGAPKQDS